MKRTSEEWEQFLKEKSKKELVDIIICRMVQDSAFRKFLDIRYGTEATDMQEAIQSFKNQIANEMATKHPDTNAVISVKDSFMEKMEEWSIYDYCVGCLVIMREIDDALSAGTGMEDESVSLLSAEMEHASECAMNAVKAEKISEADKKKLLAYLKEEAKTPLKVQSNQLLLDIITEAKNK